jgi:sec-independent protein translocase protein TatB
VTLVFGMSFGEMVVLGVVALVVVGPRNLPSLLRAAGQLIGKVRRMANDLRVESGIDEILDAEGIRSEIDNFKRLASGAISPDDLSPNVVPDREREYPRVGPDSYGAFSEDLVPYLPADLPSLAAGGATGGGGDYGGGSPEAQNLAPTDTHPTSPGSPPPAVASLPSPTPTAASPSTNGAGIKS